MIDQVITFIITVLILFLIYTILQLNGHPDITEDQTYDLVLETIDSMIDDDREGPMDNTKIGL